MAVHDQHARSFPILDSINRSRRAESFIWLSLAQLDQQFISINVREMKDSSKELIESCLSNHPEIKQEIEYKLLHRVIPIENLNWIKDSQRQTKWITQRINEDINSKITTGMLPPTTAPINFPFHLQRRDLSVAAFDYWASTFHHPSLLVMQNNILKSIWEGYSSHDQHFSWIEKENTQDKIDSFWKWLNGKSPDITTYYQKPENYDELLSILDDPRLRHHHSKELFSSSFRKIWNQQQRREKEKDKKQCNLLLSNKTISKLKALSKEYDLTQAEVIDVIINSEAKHKHYLTEITERRKFLLDEKNH
ncbi:hypothetical protein [Acidovorax sp. SDU_ACID1]|uniref:hypothetical protein n=1 Tax=Acidovorax sp. SDU_ACID1 TaxID=3136632 RepID=UPI00387362E6